MTLGEGTDAHGAQSGELELIGKACDVQTRPELTIRPVDHRIRVSTAVIDHAIVDTEAAGQQRGPTRQAGHVRGMHVVEDGGIKGECVNVGAGVAVVAVAAQMIGPQGVDVDIKNAHESIRDGAEIGAMIALNRQADSPCGAQVAQWMRDPDNRSSL